MRVPDDGIQPQVCLDATGAVHMIYFRGEPSLGDIYYVKSMDGEHFSRPIRVNSQPGSAIAVGTVRGPQMAVGRGGRVHVAWMGAEKAQPRGPEGRTPMLYARLSDDADRFEPQRNVISRSPGLDGGGTIAADRGGRVYVVWHAPDEDGDSEAHRRVWVARSNDDGATFAPENAGYAQATGACGCCGIRAFVDRRGGLFVLYRSATNGNQRDMYLLASTNGGAKFTGEMIHEWTSDLCVMSTAALTDTPASVLAAWETRGQVYSSRVDPKSYGMTTPVAATGGSASHKFPAIAANAAGEVCIAWAEGVGWQRGGGVGWQVYDKEGKVVPRAGGKADGLPVWGSAAVFVRWDGTFAVVY